MRVQILAPAVIMGLFGIIAIASPGCGGSDTQTGTASTSSGTSSSAGGSGGQGQGGGGTGGHGTGGNGAGGSGGAPASHGPSATEMVSGGEVSKSSSYKMVYTVGQPTQNQGKSTSQTYRLQGGLVGANGSLP